MRTVLSRNDVFLNFLVASADYSSLKMKQNDDSETSFNEFIVSGETMGLFTSEM
jgi:hypothetical protein